MELGNLETCREKLAVKKLVDGSNTILGAFGVQNCATLVIVGVTLDGEATETLAAAPGISYRNTRGFGTTNLEWPTEKLKLSTGQRCKNGTFCNAGIQLMCSPFLAKRQGARCAGGAKPSPLFDGHVGVSNSTMLGTEFLEHMPRYLVSILRRDPDLTPGALPRGICM